METMCDGVVRDAVPLAFLCWSLTNVTRFQPFGFAHILPA